MSSQHVLIIGGGIGGLALAQGLKKHSIPFTLFERDLSPNSRAQGYRIRIAGYGVEGLHSCLSDDLWSVFERTSAESKGEGRRLNAIDGNELPRIIPAHVTGSGSRPKQGGGPPKDPTGHREGIDVSYPADRTLLRALLLLGQEGNVKFGKSFTHYEISENGITAFFSDGTKETGTLLVGADGVNSVVRKQLLPHHKYVDTGSRVLYGKTIITPELKERFARRAMNGRIVIQDSTDLTLFLEAIRFPNDAASVSGGRIARTSDYIYWVLGGSAETIGLSDSEFHSLNGSDAADLTLKLTENWLPHFRCLFELQTISECAPLRLISAKPERPEWRASAHVTLLGDAAHAMMPAGGSGANCALADAALLLKLIVENGIDEEVMEKYVDEIWGYALPAIQVSAIGAKMLLGFKGWEDTKEVDV